MGWTFPNNKRTVKSVHAEIVADYIASGFQVLRQTLNGNHGILALVTPSNRKIVTVILYSTQGGSVGYKEMSEDCGPFFYDVPKIYIDLTEDRVHERSQYAIDWRAKVLKRNEDKKKANSIYKKLPIGYELIFNGVLYHAYSVNGSHNEFADGKYLYRVNDGAILRASKAQFIEAIIDSFS